MRVSWIATNAGEDTEVGLSEPPGPISNVAGSRTFVAPPAGGPEPVVAPGEAACGLGRPALVADRPLVGGLGAPAVAGAELVELIGRAGVLA